MNDSLPNEWQHLVDDFWKKTTDQQQQQQHQQDIPPLDSVIENAINQKQENNLILTKLPTFSSLLSGSTDIQPGFLSRELAEPHCAAALGSWAFGAGV